MKKTLTAAQIGCGKFARSQDFPNMAKHPDVTLKWACDVNPDNAKTAAEQFHVPETTTDFMEVVNDPEVDMIKIATTHEAHLPIIEAAAKAGKHIFCEKPMAKHDKEAYLIMKAVRRNGEHPVAAFGPYGAGLPGRNLIQEVVIHVFLLLPH